MRWDPAATLQRAFCEPEGSPVLLAARRFHRAPAACLLGTREPSPEVLSRSFTGSTPCFACWSPDGSRLLLASGAGSDQEIALLDAVTGEQIALLQARAPPPMLRCFGAFLLPLSSAARD